MQLHQTYGDQGLDVIAMNMDGLEEKDAANKMLSQLDLPLVHWGLNEGMTEAGLAAVQVKDGAVPAIHLYDRKGRLRYRFDGVNDKEELERAIGELLGE